MEFKPKEGMKYYYDIYSRKYYEIVKATQYGEHLVDIKVRDCEIKFLRIDVRPKDNFINKETIEEFISELVPIGRVKKLPSCDLLRTFELRDNLIIKQFN